MMLDDCLIAPDNVLLASQQAQVAIIQNVLLVGGKVAVFLFSHAGSVKNCGEDVPKKGINSSRARLPSDEGTRPNLRAIPGLPNAPCPRQIGTLGLDPNETPVK